MWRRPSAKPRWDAPEPRHHGAPAGGVGARAEGARPPPGRRRARPPSPCARRAASADGGAGQPDADHGALADAVGERAPGEQRRDDADGRGREQRADAGQRQASTRRAAAGRRRAARAGAAEMLAWAVMPDRQHRPTGTAAAALRRQPARPSAEVLREEALDGAVGVHPVLRLDEAVALVVLDHVLHLDAARAQGRDDLVRLGLGDARVVGALDHQQRGRDVVDPVERRARLEVGQLLGVVRVADVAEPGARQQRAPVGGERAHQRDEARRADHADRGREDVGREGGADQRGVPAVGAAVDRRRAPGRRCPRPTSHSTPSIRSSCILPANSRSAACVNALPKPVEPR